MQTKALLQFLTELKQNNNKDWFDKNRKEYLSLKSDFTVLVEDTLIELQKFDNEVGIVNPKDCLYRINRDIRFSKDKSPYKTWFACGICPQGKTSGMPIYYFHIEPEKLYLGAGCWEPSPDRLRALRHYIVTHPELYYKIREYMEEKQLFFDELDGCKGKRLPNEFKEFGEFSDVLLLKSQIVRERRELSEIVKVDELVEYFKLVIPVVKWLREGFGYVYK